MTFLIDEIFVAYVKQHGVVSRKDILNYGEQQRTNKLFDRPESIRAVNQHQNFTWMIVSEQIYCTCIQIQKIWIQVFSTYKVYTLMGVSIYWMREAARTCNVYCIWRKTGTADCIYTFLPIISHSHFWKININFCIV